MINFFKPTPDKTPSVPHTLVQNTVRTFRGIYKRVTEIVQTANAKPPLIPYIPNEETPFTKKRTPAQNITHQRKKIDKPQSRLGKLYRTVVTDMAEKARTKPPLIPYIPAEISEKPSIPEQSTPRIVEAIQTTREVISESIQRIKDDERKKEHIAHYHALSKLSDGIEETLYKSRENHLSTLQQKVLRATVEKAQQKLQSHLRKKLPLGEEMNKTQMELLLSKEGYVRFQRGMTGYASLYNSLESHDREHLDTDGSIWVHHTVGKTAEESTSTDEVLHTCWDRIEEGTTPIYHVDRLMYLLGYTEAPERQVYYSIDRSTSKTSTKEYTLA